MPTYWLRQAAAIMMSEDRTDSDMQVQVIANRADSESKACLTTGNGPARLGGARAVPAEPDGPLRWSWEAVVQPAGRGVQPGSL